MHILLQQNTLAHYRRGLLRELLKLPDLSITVVSSSKSDTPFLEVAKFEETSNLRLVDAPVMTLNGPKETTFTWQPGAIRELLKFRPDVVIAQGSPYVLTAWVLVVLGRLLHVPVLLWTHGLLEPEAGVKWAIRAGLYRMAAGLLLYGERARSLLAQQGLPATHTHVIYNSLDVDEQTRHFERTSRADIVSLKASCGVTSAERVIIFVGRLQRVKAIDRLIAAVAALNDQGRRVHLLLIGEGEGSAALKAQSNSLGGDAYVHFWGPIHDEQRLAEAFSVSDLCVIPSGPGLTVMHSMAYGVPVLTTNRREDQFPEAEAIIPHETGFFCDTDDQHKLARELALVLFPTSPRVTMESKCRAMVLSRFTPKNQARLLERAARQAWVSSLAKD